MFSILALDFMVRALIAGAMTGVMAPAVGSYIVQRKLSLLGDGLGHVAITGVGLALLTGSSPVPVAMAICIAGAVLIELLRQSGRASGDVGLAILFYGGLASGVLMAGKAGRGAGMLSQFLFGSLTSVDHNDVITVGVMALILLVLVIGLSPQLFAVCADEDYARTQGLSTKALNLLIVVLAAVTVAMSMRTVGLMLVSALMVIPVATSSNIVHGFRRGLYLSMFIGFLCAVGGVILSFYLDLVSGATIVVLSILVFIITLPFSRLSSRSSCHQGLTTQQEQGHDPVLPEVPTEPNHAHHAILHGDHVDFLHDGLRHATDGDHHGRQ